jgi:thiamine biosynthesis lipoprotein
MYLEDKGVDTSGDYERYFTLDGKRYSHIIDPRSGYPAEGVMSATVIAGSSVIADIVATTLCVLGNNAMDAVSASGSEDAILVYDDNGAVKVSITKGAVERYGIQEKVI